MDADERWRTASTLHWPSSCVESDFNGWEVGERINGSRAVLSCALHAEILRGHSDPGPDGGQIASVRFSDEVACTRDADVIGACGAGWGGDEGAPYCAGHWQWLSEVAFVRGPVAGVMAHRDLDGTWYRNGQPHTCRRR